MNRMGGRKTDRRMTCTARAAARIATIVIMIDVCLQPTSPECKSPSTYVDRTLAASSLSPGPWGSLSLPDRRYFQLHSRECGMRGAEELHDPRKPSTRFCLLGTQHKCQQNIDEGTVLYRKCSSDDIAIRGTDRFSLRFSKLMEWSRDPSVLVGNAKLVPS
ncbi:hypothetical protein K435DRAFT_159936 [Dendrothele bispora CBS 962.96]|uniref:Uncharacterized protein n=1 Tax=Dendrothele bispora (strain CBS 962.96) TaxID=1314807 RepID=A0A4S8MP91_DENBC|nr:hypothetical protein K435DRAFT_159936 [Dendrothele bispora CBS 962.96]